MRAFSGYLAQILIEQDRGLHPKRTGRGINQCMRFGGFHEGEAVQE